MPGEKIYIQFDKSAYLAGDTIWFKAYVFNASYLTPSAQSGILYIDVANEDGFINRRFRLLVTGGVTCGSIKLKKEDFKEGSYILRAYTNWLQNFGDDHFFYHRFYVTGANENSILVNTRSQAFTLNGKDSITTVLQFTKLDKTPLHDKRLVLTGQAAKKNIFKSEIITDKNGVMNINFTLPQKASQVTLTATDKTSLQKTIVPLSLTRPENIDLQFMPEGGYLVAGLAAHVGFKAIGEDGKAVNVQGVVVNSNNKQLASFSALHIGMGTFDMIPAAGENYSAVIHLPGGGLKSFSLPGVKAAGISLQIFNTAGADSVELFVSATPGFLRGADSLILLGQSRSVVCYGAILKLENGAVKRTIAKALFPVGIARFTLFTTARHPVNERLVYIDGEEAINIDINTGDSTFGPRDSIPVNIAVKDETGLPVAGNFSVAITDDSQVKTSVSSRQGIVSYMQLSSDLKGYIEEPGYYLQAQDSVTWRALDNLLLTQGWAGFDWQQVFTPPTPKYAPELEFAVKGRVVNGFNKGFAHTTIDLLSQKPFLLFDTLTDAKGGFLFTNFPALDTPAFKIQARNRNGQSFNVGVEVDDVAPPVFNAPHMTELLPWYVNTDSTLLTLTQTKQQLDKNLLQGITLAPVTVFAKKIVQGSQNLNGSGNADQVFNEVDLEKEGKKTLNDLLVEKVKNFHVKVFTGTTFRWYYITYKWVKFVIDGIQLDDVYQFNSFADLQGYLSLYTAEDIKGIEVNESDKYTTDYIRRFIPADEQFDIDWTEFGFAFIEITTRGGTGPVPVRTPGTYLYKGVPFSWPKKFYSPRYTVKDTSDNSLDLRSTIFWEPNVITDATGKASVSFYAADKPATYTLILEGTDFNGNVAVKTKRIVIKAEK